MLDSRFLARPYRWGGGTHARPHDARTFYSAECSDRWRQLI